MNQWPIYLSGVLTGLAIGMVILQVAIADIKRRVGRIIQMAMVEQLERMQRRGKI